MRVTYVSDEWRRNGGVASYLRRLAAAMAARGDAVQVLHNDRSADAEPGVQDTFVDGSTIYDGGREGEVAAARHALEAVGRFRPEVVHVQSCNNFTLEAGLRAAYPATKTLHVYDFCPTNTKFHHALERHCEHPTSVLCLPRIGYKRCTTSRRPSVWLHMQRRAGDANRNNAGYRTIIVASEYVRRDALATGYPAGQVEVVPYFVTPGDRAEAEPRLIVTAGRLVREKGFDLFIDALARLPRPWRAVLAGDGMERAALERRARDKGIGDLLEFAGWQDEAGMAALYRRATLVVMPSRWPEPSGIVGLEAMAYGRPVVAFAVGGIPEWLRHGVTGLLAPPHDVEALAASMGALLDDPAKAAAMGEAGRARALSDFSEHGHLARLDALYGSLAGATG
jgi:glycosyltransferase involved in cell wall biosynthesis